MKTMHGMLLAAGVLLAGLSGGAMARDNVSFSLSFGVPAYAPPPPVYYAPPPVVYYSPPPPRVVYVPAAPVFGFSVHGGHRHGWHRGHRHVHRSHHRHHRH